MPLAAEGACTSQIGAGEGAACDLAGGQGDGAVQHAVGAIAADTRAVPDCDPDAALGVGGHAVRAFTIAQRDEGLAVLQRPFVRDIEAIDDACRTVGVIEDLTVRAEGRAVGDAIAGVGGAPCQVRVETIERSLRLRPAA